MNQDNLEPHQTDPINNTQPPKQESSWLRVPSIQVQSVDFYISRLRLWALLVLPLSGYLLGQILQYVLKIKENAKFQALLVHGITMGFLILIFDDILFNPDALKDLHSKVLFLAISYLFVLGLVLGIVV